MRFFDIFRMRREKHRTAEKWRTARLARTGRRGEDFGSEEEILLRKNCARILHRYLQKVMGVRDVTTGLPSYEDVRDIYDCRICAPHISQVLARGIMETRTRGNLQLFEGNREVLKEEASLYISRMLKKGQKEI